MAVNLAFIGGAGWQFFTDNGIPLNGGKIYTYAAGTTTPLATYTSRDGLTPNTNPIILDAAGRTPEQIWSTEGVLYKYVVKDANDVLIRTWDNIGGSVVSSNLAQELANTTDNTKGDALIGFKQSNASGFLTGAVARTINDKTQEIVSIKDFGAVGNGSADDTAAIQAALNASFHVVVPAGMTPLITSTITVPLKTKLEFLSGTGVLSSVMPGSYLVKSSTLNGVGLYILGTAIVSGGGMFCQPGNGGDGVQLAGNSSILRDFIVVQAGRDGVRVGVDGVYANTNSTIVEYVRSRDNGRYGFYLHDGVSVVAADANAGIVANCTAIGNASDGFRLGHCWWVTVINCLAEINGGYGLYLSGIDNGTYPECRWATIIGGDYNEGNNGTVNVNQVYDSSYFSAFVNPDSRQFPTNTTTTGLQGAGLRAQFGGAAGTSCQGITVYTGADNQYPVIFDSAGSAGVTNGPTIRKRTAGNNGDGICLTFNLAPNFVDPYLQTGRIRSVQASGGEYSLVFDAYRAGPIEAARLNANAKAFTPGLDNDWSVGFVGLRWSTIYAATGSINTSDAREKQQVRPLADTELAVAKRLKSLIRAFKWTASVNKKGDAARTHVGIMAQDVEAAFKAEGLNGFDYGLLCYDVWGDEYEPEYKTEIITDANGEKVETQVPTGKQKLVRAAGNSYGVRYDQLTLFILAAMGDA